VNYFLDTSALAKRYVNEVGTEWVRSLIDPTANHVIVICELTPVEYFSVLGRRQREGLLTPTDSAIFQARFLVDYRQEYISVWLQPDVLMQARNLLLQYSLRTLDAIQLASALIFQQTFQESIIFVSADQRLLALANEEGLSMDNPLQHP
jgi:hypothetical protein